MTPVEATYLAWLDLRAYGLDTKTMLARCEKAGVVFTGGTFSFKQPEIAGEIVYEKCQTIIDTGANVICGADVPCLMNIKGALGRMRADGRLDRDIRVMHIAQILDSRG